MVAVGAAVIVILVVTGTDAHPPEAGIVYVTVYVPAVDVPKLISPVVALIDKPAVEEYVPPVDPVSVTDAVPPFEQYGEPAYEIVAAGNAVIVTLVVAVTTGQPFAAAIV